MYIPFALFFNYDSPFPWFTGPALLVLGFAGLWATRFTSRLYPVWGGKYYLFSSIVRPLGILMIAWAWVEIFAARAPIDFHIEEQYITQPLFLTFAIVFGLLTPAFRKFVFVIIVLELIDYILFYTYGLILSDAGFLPVFLCALFWSVRSLTTLGFRRSFLFASEEDRLITDGPYQYHRHPQLISALVLSFSLIPMVFSPGETPESIIFRTINLALMYVLILYTIKAEEKDLIARFGQEYKDYMEQVPGLFGVLEWKKAKTPKFGTAIKLALAAYFISIVLLFVLGYIYA